MERSLTRPGFTRWVVLSAAGVFAVAYGLENFTTRDDLTVALTIIYLAQVLAGAMAIVLVILEIVNRLRSGDQEKH